MLFFVIKDSRNQASFTKSGLKQGGSAHIRRNKLEFWTAARDGNRYFKASGKDRGSSCIFLSRGGHPVVKQEKVKTSGRDPDVGLIKGLTEHRAMHELKIRAINSAAGPRFCVG